MLSLRDPDVILRRREVEEKIAEARRMVHALERELNTLLPSSQLPPEILGAIFEECKPVARSEGRPRPFVPMMQGNENSWIAVTHVCHYWRTVAISTPQLWGDIIVDLASKPEWTSMLLARSKPGPLTIRLCGDDRRESLGSLSLSAVVVFLRDRIHRVRKQISQQDNITTLDTRSLDRFFCEYDSSSSPSILHRSLKHLSTRGYHHSLIPLTRLSSSCPSLATLSISDYMVYDVSLWRFPNSLTTLRVMDATDTSATRRHDPQLMKLLHVLRGLPSLRQLEVCIRSPVSGISTGGVSLPKLRCLTVTGDQSACVALLDHLDLPITLHRLEICLTLSSGPDTTLLTLAVIVSHISNAFPTVQSCSLDLGDLRQRDVIVTGCRHIPPSNYNALSSHRIGLEKYPGFLFRISSPPQSPRGVGWVLGGADLATQQLGAGINVEAVVEAVLPALPVSEARAVHLAATADWVAYLMNRVLETMNAAQDLYICGPVDTFVPTWVGDFLRTLRSEATGQVFLPSLRALYLRHVDVRDIYRPIVDILRHRAVPSTQFRIVLRQCFGANLADIETLRKVVSVDWDRWNL